MANLTSGSIGTVHQEIMAFWSAVGTETPITKSEARGLIVAIDTGLSSAEVDIFNGLPAGPGKTWLLANQTIGRFVIEEVARKRRTDI